MKIQENNLPYKTKAWVVAGFICIKSENGEEEAKATALEVATKLNLSKHLVLSNTLPVDTAEMDRIDGVERDPNKKDLIIYYFEPIEPKEL